MFLTKKRFKEFLDNDFTHLRQDVREIRNWTVATLVAVVGAMITVLGAAIFYLVQH